MKYSTKKTTISSQFTLPLSFPAFVTTFAVTDELFTDYLSGVYFIILYSLSLCRFHDFYSYSEMPLAGKSTDLSALCLSFSQEKVQKQL